MLPKHLKIGRRARIEHILKKGGYSRTPYFQLKFLPNKHKFCRFSLIISKKISSKAVERNKIRRRIYEALRLSRAGFRIGPAYDIVILVAPRTAKASYEVIANELIGALHKL